MLMNFDELHFLLLLISPIILTMLMFIFLDKVKQSSWRTGSQYRVAVYVLFILTTILTFLSVYMYLYAGYSGTQQILLMSCVGVFASMLFLQGAIIHIIVNGITNTIKETSEL